MTRKKPQPVNLPLKLAILSTGLTQRRFARRLRLSELRLSEIIHYRCTITPDEKARLARELKQPIYRLFPADLEGASS